MGVFKENTLIAKKSIDCKKVMLKKHKNNNTIELLGTLADGAKQLNVTTRRKYKSDNNYYTTRQDMA